MSDWLSKVKRALFGKRPEVPISYGRAVNPADHDAIGEDHKLEVSVEEPLGLEDRGVLLQESVSQEDFLRQRVEDFSHQLPGVELRQIYLALERLNYIRKVEVDELTRYWQVTDSGSDVIRQADSGLHELIEEVLDDQGVVTLQQHAPGGHNNVPPQVHLPAPFSLKWGEFENNPVVKIYRNDRQIMCFGLYKAKMILSAMEIIELFVQSSAEYPEIGSYLTALDEQWRIPVKVMRFDAFNRDGTWIHRSFLRLSANAASIGFGFGKAEALLRFKHDIWEFVEEYE